MALIPTARRDQGMLGICIFAVGLTYLFFQFVYTPKGEELDQRQDRVTKLEESNEAIRREIARGTAAKLKEEADMYGRMLTQMRQLVPISNEVPGLIEQISNAARQTGLEIGGVTPLGTIPGEVFETYRYNMTVTGSYHRIGQFLDNVGTLTRIMAPMNVTLRPTNRASVKPRPNERVIDAAFEIQTYVLKTQPRPAPPPPAGGQ